MSAFTAVGMRFRGNHVFSSGDSIVLQEDDNNPHDVNAVKILVVGENSLTHVAYASRHDCLRLRAAMTGGRRRAYLIAGSPMSARLCLS